MIKKIMMMVTLLTIPVSASLDFSEISGWLCQQKDIVSRNQGKIGFAIFAAYALFQHYKMNKLQKKHDALQKQVNDLPLNTMQEEVDKALAHVYLELQNEVDRLRGMLQGDANKVRSEVAKLAKERDQWADDMQFARIDLVRVEAFVKSAFEGRGQAFLDEVLIVMRDIDRNVAMLQERQRSIQQALRNIENDAGSAAQEMRRIEGALSQLSGAVTSLSFALQQCSAKVDVARTKSQSLEIACETAKGSVSTAEKDAGDVLARVRQLAGEVSAISQMLSDINRQMAHAKAEPQAYVTAPPPEE